MTSPAIRPATPADVPRICELISELADYERSGDQVTATTADLAAALFGPESAVFAHVADSGGDIVGFALWFLNFSTWLGKHGIYLEDLYVTPACRGQGIGTQGVPRLLVAENRAVALQHAHRQNLMHHK